MAILIIGAAISIIGLILLILWWKEFLMILSGTIPCLLLLGGAFIIYLGFDKLKEAWSKETLFSDAVSEEVDKYKYEIDELKKEIESLKKG
ncbi:hypothetical protein [Desulfobacterium sp. N47]|uniref:Uncharacterized protein n=1 Tax=uncultured Desulfobacterium sp. TaxID=201089 RepID=E1YD70_9BACT|nr:hypothetical protein N47_G38380 [uncultured Desulfobacterium sp.]